MTNRVLSFKPAVEPYGRHDPSAALFEDGILQFGTEEERYVREKHAVGRFPEQSIRACLNHADISLEEVDKIVLPYRPKLMNKRLKVDFKQAVSGDNHIAAKAWSVIYHLRKHLQARFVPDIEVRDQLSDIGTSIPPIEHRAHHRCHAASAFHPTDFDEALVLTIDGRGEYDSTVLWRADKTGLERIRTYESPNSLGRFFGVITEYLGYRAFNGEGKVMGLAPYGEVNREIEMALCDLADFGVDYDVTGLTAGGRKRGVDRLEDLFERPAKEEQGEFDQFHKDVAAVAQHLLEETVVAIVQEYLGEVDSRNVGLAGGVALNCKMNKRIIELSDVDEIFIQPVAHDGGLAIGAGWLESAPYEVEPMSDVYWGPSSENVGIKTLFETNKIEYEQSNDVHKYIAECLANGALVGWMQGRQEMGPRALGNRSILADPRTTESLDRVNKYVKHREEWRPFAPSMLEDVADEYLINAEQSPYMIKTFDTVPEKREDIKGVIHPADKTTRPQTVNEKQNPDYYKLIEEFGSITGVPVVLNTSFNDHAEPIVTKPVEALRDFYGMGLDVLVIEDYVVHKPGGMDFSKHAEDTAQ